MSNQEIFEAIYRTKRWGARRRFWKRFYSGVGSEVPAIVEPYIEAVAPFVREKSVVDIGCGDFQIGKRIAPLAKEYIGCDVARPLIAYNNKTYGANNVRFVVIDAANDPLPPGEVATIRQVLQHLSNADIAKVIAKLPQYERVIVTEQVASGEFRANIDMPTGPHTRGDTGSGIVLTAEPFNLRCKWEELLCEVPYFASRIRTTLYAFR